MDEKMFVDGLFFNAPSEKAPDFVIGSLSIRKAEFIKSLSELAQNDKGYVRIDVLRSKSGKPYCKINTYGLNNSKGQMTNDTSTEQINEDMPF